METFTIIIVVFLAACVVYSFYEIGKIREDIRFLNFENKLLKERYLKILDKFKENQEQLPSIDYENLKQEL